MAESSPSFPVICEAVASFPDREHFHRAVANLLAAGFAALVGAGLGGAALKELFDDYTAPRHAEDFEAALHAGAALLWVRCEDSERELRATRILEEAGGRHVHVHGRSPS